MGTLVERPPGPPSPPTRFRLSPSGIAGVSILGGPRWTLTAYPSQTDADGSILVARESFDGLPIAGAEVCFNVMPEPGASPPDSEHVYSGQVTDGAGAVVADTTGSTPAPAPSGVSGYLCASTNSSGEAAIEVTADSPTAVDVVAWFVDAGAFRDVVATVGPH